MQKYKSEYPTLRQAKTHWSKPSLVAKQGEGPSRDWYEMMKKDARAKLAASIHQSHTGSIHRQERIVREDRIGKQTPSAESIAKKHNKEVAEIQAQIDKGIKVEREHTNSDEEAHEIARDHLDEFPDYYDRLDKMEKKAKKDMKEEITDNERRLLHSFKRDKNSSQLRAAVELERVRKLHSFKDGRTQQSRKKKPVKEDASKYNPEREQLRNRIEAHKEVAIKMAAKHGEKSMEASFHRALVRRWQKELGEDTLKEEVANSVGGGMSPVIGGEGNIHGYDPIMSKPIRRRKFAGKQVFVVDPTTYHKAYLGKRKYEHYEKYLEGSPYYEEIRAYGRKYWDEPIILENEQTGAMVYLKYGSK